MNRVDGAPCFVLHLRPYRDTSALVDLFSLEHGRFTCVAKGLRGSGRSRQHWRAALQVFNLVSASWQGRNELKSLLDVQQQQSYSLKGRALFCGFYINELLERLLYPLDPHSEVFLNYTHCISQLAIGADLEPTLRRFEFGLLESLGYGINFTYCTQSQEPVESNRFYQFEVGEGLRPASENAVGMVFSGADLLQLAADDFGEDTALRAAKQLNRAALSVLLGDKPLRSRTLFTSSAVPINGKLPAGNG
ncbi:DNA repair protein RecO [Zhongshania aliphaticivorans]|uniref:DNA repair protein RecO n=1 Tax=Zhongshania aliphaticivorans TaxID=1470434 RepID=UPI0012E6660F|nr:DNA repair protein RecO [Zhongshania aliphaticivorans]CAA0080548.1 DNA repair protein RecO [Zhongshania aliphaticivorans]